MATVVSRQFNLLDLTTSITLLGCFGGWCIAVLCVVDLECKVDSWEGNAPDVMLPGVHMCLCKMSTPCNKGLVTDVLVTHSSLHCTTVQPALVFKVPFAQQCSTSSTCTDTVMCCGH